MNKMIKTLFIAAGIAAVTMNANAAPTDPQVGGICAGTSLAVAKQVKEEGRPDLAKPAYDIYNRQEARFKGNRVYEENMRMAFNHKYSLQDRVNVLKGCVSRDY